ncbi:hypothetical protein CLUG_00670 [Clavispora lusitaniae ATCC 42720]|uniref:Signal recognition particle SEC65 subunit n=1 Tax=Clavispora lusitaniae (strain ATCC 42720) TaxID=306902 RepID=C4XXJ7_CLAL4|nr:uncharacterized protein CLUG_00670 [Clavispora lusitaniae ATCC 42720]EEQ36547.1 hypothetical protein CLUG_00670 [Clavispora lusitaniae ATCC 42720]KAF5212983.1 signal recognition particle subunit [Clavispora lusitaniae]
MPKKPVLEEVDDDDIDNMDMDIAQFDPNLKTPIAPIQKPVITRSQDSEPSVFDNFPKPAPQPKRSDIVDPSKFSAQEREEIRRFQVIYPCYFDVNRSHKEGRRVSTQDAVRNPLAKTISDACRQLRIPVLLELDKSHPQDYGNPGRVRVLVKENGVAGNSRFPNKRALLLEISKYLKEHPTTLASVGRSSGIPYPPEFETYEPEELPQLKNKRMNTIVPIHSNLTLKHPMTKSIYEPLPETPEAPKLPKAPKQQKKIMKIRG